MKTCFPAAAVRSTWAPCSLCGVANTTASIAASARIASRLSASLMPCSAQNDSAWARVRLWPEVKQIVLLLPWTEPTSVRPHRPIPTIAARIMAFLPRQNFTARFYTLCAAGAMPSAKDHRREPPPAHTPGAKLRERLRQPDARGTGRIRPRSANRGKCFGGGHGGHQSVGDGGG